MNICTYTPIVWTETVEQYISILTAIVSFQISWIIDIELTIDPAPLSGL